MTTPKPAAITPEIVRAARYSALAMGRLHRARAEQVTRLWREIGEVESTSEDLRRLCRDACSGDDLKLAQTILAAYVAAEKEAM